MEIYDSSEVIINYKRDNSPVTNADICSNQIIAKTLKLSPHPILSEEDTFTYDIRKYWETFWMIDPLDGTKEFLNKNGEFTINISLIENQTPVLGVVYCPAFKTLYFAEKNFGSYKIEGISNIESFDKVNFIDLSKSTPPITYTLILSRSHLNSETETFIKNQKKIYDNIKVIHSGSSLKICKVAEGKANCYPRLGPTMEWDIAAAHAIIKYSGKNIYDFDSNKELIYNKKSLYNSYFIVR